MNIETGMLVTLLSGGPCMAVQHQEGRSVHCEWFVHPDLIPKRSPFDALMLREWTAGDERARLDYFSSSAE